MKAKFPDLESYLKGFIGEHKQDILPLTILSILIILSMVGTYLTLNQYAAPFSNDAGTYVLEAKIYLHTDLWQTGPKFPPFTILPISFLLLFFNELVALKIAVVFYSVATAIPFYFLAKEITKTRFLPLIPVSLLLYYPLYTLMMGWANYPAYLGFAFICLSVLFLIRSLKNPSLLNIVLTGLSISLIAASDIIPFYYFILGFISFILFSVIFDLSGIKRLFSIVLKIALATCVFFIPYIQIYWRIFVGLMGSSGVSTAPLSLSQVVSLFQKQVSPWSFWVIIIGFALLFFIFRAKKDKSILVMGSYTITFLILPFIAQINYRPTRPYYYLMLFLFLFLAVFLKVIYDLLRGKQRVDYSKIGLNRIRLKINFKKHFQNPKIFKIRLTILKVILLIFIVISLSFIQVSYVSESFSSLPSSIEYYNVMTDDYLDVLSWAKTNVNPDAGILSISSESWVYSKWIEALAERRAIEIAKVYPNGKQLGTLSSELAISNKASAALDGNFVVENGDLRLVDVFPALTFGSPKIAINSGIYQDVLAVDESVAKITTVNATSECLYNLHHIQPDYSGMSLLTSSDNINRYSVIYNWSDLSFSRTTTLEKGSTSVDICFNLSSSSVIDAFTIPVYARTKSSILSVNDVGSQVNLTVNDVISRPINSTVTISDTSLCEAEIVPKLTSSNDVYALILSAHSNSSSISVSINVGFDISNSDSSLTYFTSMDWLNENNFKYVLVDTGSRYFYSYSRWFNDSGIFQQVYCKGNIFLYKIIG